MIKCMRFTSDVFDHNDDNDVISPVTKNLILLCSSVEIMDIISDELLNIQEAVEYGTGNHKDANVINIIYHMKTSIFDVDNGKQRLIITTEPAFTIAANNKWDIWFAAYNKENKIEIYPFAAFVGHEKLWHSGLAKVYKSILVGRFGDFGSSI